MGASSTHLTPTFQSSDPLESLISDGLLVVQTESLGYVDISLSDVVNNKRINEKYSLIDSRHGQIQVELLWRTT